MAYTTLIKMVTVFINNYRIGFEFDIIFNAKKLLVLWLVRVVFQQ